MKYLLVVLVVVFVWMMLTRRRGGGAAGAKPAARPELVTMVQCAHCGLHLAATDAVPEGSRLYCSDAHRRLGPATTTPH